MVKMTMIALSDAKEAIFFPGIASECLFLSVYGYGGFLFVAVRLHQGRFFPESYWMKARQRPSVTDLYGVTVLFFL